MICITDKPVAMTEWTRIHRTDVESFCARKSSPEEESIIEKSIETHNQNADKPPQHGQNTKGSRIRRHSSYEPSLDDIKEEGHDDLETEEKDLAAVHRERAFNSVSYKRKSEGRQFRKKMYKSFTPRPRAFTC